MTKEQPIHVSNVAIWNPVTQKADRVGDDDAGGRRRKGRVFKVNGEQIGAGGQNDGPPEEFYRKEVVPALVKQFGYASVMQVPRIEKIVLNMGVMGEATGDKKILDNAVGDMQKIAGQKPVVTKARKAIAGFKIREGYPIGCMVTLRATACTSSSTACHHRAAARPRLPRRVGPRVRRPRELQHGRQGTDHLPGDRVRQDRRDPRDGHHDHDDREDRRRGKALPAAFRFPVQGNRDPDGQAGLGSTATRSARSSGREVRRSGAPRCVAAIVDEPKASMTR